MQKPVKYISNKELLVELGRSKASYSYFIAPEYSVFDAIVPSVDMLTSEFLTNTIKTKANKMSTKANPVDPESIDRSSIVFRVMTDSHLPPETDEKRRKKSSTGEWVTKPNFPPFKHYIFRDEELVEVGRSHWRDGFDNGSFCLTHGRISDRLARMFMMLAEQYSRRRNWGGYCVDEATEALTQRGWLGIDDITEDDIILSYEDGKLKWSKIKSIYRGKYDGKMFALNVIGMDALVTPGHKFVTDKGLKKVEHLEKDDYIILMGEAVEGGTGCEYVKDLSDLSMPFILSLSEEQRKTLLEMIMTDGWKNHPEAFMTLSAMNGDQVSIKDDWVYVLSDRRSVECFGTHGIPKVNYIGRVWCPETEFGSFMVRRNGTVYLTGNSYRDEFVASALVHLSAVGLQFDESRSIIPNPFAFLTQIIKHVFTRVVNLEKRNQNIRDDLLIMAGAIPSFSKQIDDEFDQRESYDDRPDAEPVVKKSVAAKRGRKPKAKVVA